MQPFETTLTYIDKSVMKTLNSIKRPVTFEALHHLAQKHVSYVSLEDVRISAMRLAKARMASVRRHPDGRTLVCTILRWRNRPTEPSQCGV